MGLEETKHVDLEGRVNNDYVVAGMRHAGGRQSFKINAGPDSAVGGAWLIGGGRKANPVFSSLAELGRYYQTNQGNPEKCYDGSFEHAFFFEQKSGITVYNHSGEVFRPPSFLRWQTDGRYYSDVTVNIADIRKDGLSTESARCFIAPHFGRYLEREPTHDLLSSNFVEHLYYQSPIKREKIIFTRLIEEIWQGYSQPKTIRPAAWFFKEEKVKGWLAEQIVTFGKEVRLLARKRLDAQRNQSSFRSGSSQKSSNGTGFVYILKNPAFPKLIKVGFTDRADVEERARELSASSSVPYPFVVVFSHAVENPRATEGLVHKKFASRRANQNREFFEVDPSIVIRFLIEQK